VAAGSGGGKAAGAAAKAAPSASQAVAEMEDAEVANADRLAVNRNGAGGKAGKAASGGGAAAGEPDDRNEESPTAGKKRAGAGAAGGVTAAKDQASSKGTGTAALNPKAATTAGERHAGGACPRVVRVRGCKACNGACNWTCATLGLLEPSRARGGCTCSRCSSGVPHGLAGKRTNSAERLQQDDGM